MEFGVFPNILTSLPGRAKGNFANFSQGEGNVVGLDFSFQKKLQQLWEHQLKTENMQMLNK